MTHVASLGRLDAIMLVEKLRDQLPAGSSQSYAAMLVLNHLESYSEKSGLQIEEKDRSTITALSLEFLYLAWYNDVGIELSERQLESWPSHVWKNSANLGVNLHSLVKQPNLRLIHDRLRDVRTLLSFGAVVNRYYELIQHQTGGLKAFLGTYQPVEPEDLEPPPPSLTPSPPSFLGTYATGSINKTSNSGWNWLSWGKDNKAPKNQPNTPLEMLTTPGSMPPPPVEVIPLYTTDATVHFHLVSCPVTSNTSTSSSLIASCDSGTISSSGTNESIATTHISALERMEAYLSVLGTPQFEPVKPLPVRNPRLVSLVEAEKAAKVRTLQTPVRKPIQLPLTPFMVTVQRELPGSRNEPMSALRWATGEELKSRKVVWKPVDHRLHALKGNKRPPKLKLEPPRIVISKDAGPEVITVDRAGSNGGSPEVLPLRVIKKASKAASDQRGECKGASTPHIL